MSSKAKDTGFLRNLVKYDSSGNITLPAALSIFTNKEVATKEYVDSRFTSIINDAPSVLDTLSELATAIGNDGNFATTITSSINTKANKSTTLTINGTAYDLSANRSWTIDSMVYPAAGIALSTGTGWGTSITNNSTNWNTAYGWGNHATAGYEASSNKSNNPSLGTSDTLYPTQSAVKSYVDSAVTGGVNIQGDWNASTNTPNISGTTTTGFTWRVSVAGNTNLGGITTWNVNDLAVKTAGGWIKIDNSSSVVSVFGRQGVVVANSGDYNTSQVTESGNLYFTNARARAAFSAGTNITIDVNGVIASTYAYSLPVATATVLGGVKIGSGVTITNGVISVSTNYEAPITAGTTAQYWRGDKTWQTLPTYTLPTASGTVLGGIKVGTNLSIDANGVLSSTDTNTWNANSKDVAGYVAAPGAIANKVWKTDGAGNPAWRDDADTVYSLPTATAAVLGGVKIGNGILISTGVISNYIYDTRNTRGATRLYRRDSDSDYSVQTYWTGTLWRLYGYNGDTAHADVHVGYSDSTGSVAWGNVSGRPTALSQFTNDLGNYGGWITSAGTAAAISQTVAADSAGNLVYSQMADNDFFRIRVGGASNGGWAEIATADDGTEPIYVRQYTGVFTSVTRTATLLDGSGNTTFPGTVYASSFSGTSYWSNISGRPTHLSQFTNDLGNYGNWLVRSGDSMSGRLTINTTGSDNTPLLIYSVEPYIQINAQGGSNTAGLRIYPTSGYNALVGNYTPGQLVLVGSNTEMVYINGSRMLVSGYIQATAFYESSDIRYKNVIETNPEVNLDALDVIKFTRKGSDVIRYGYSAQQVKKLSEHLVGGTENELTVNYSDVHTLKIARLEKEIAELKAKLNN